MRSSRSKGGGRWRLVLAVVAVAVVAWAARGAFHVGGTPEITLKTSFPALGSANQVSASFEDPRDGLGRVRLELVQGDRVEVVAERSFSRPSPFALPGRSVNAGTVLEATVGTATQPWLVDGPAVVRAVADRAHGPLRRVEPVRMEITLPVRTRPPRLEIVSRQHFVREGGSGVVVLRVGDHVTSCGVRAGQAVSPASSMLGGRADERVAVYAVPWDLSDGNQVRAFAEDDAGNRVEQPFLDGFRTRPEHNDAVEVSDTFLERVVPAIVSRTPGLAAQGSLLDQYLEINGAERKRDLQVIRDLSSDTADRPLWEGAFLQLPRSAVQAGFADRRSYRYKGEVVDHQTHLGLDLASTARSPVPAANSGRVVYAGWLAIYGNFVLIDHGLGIMTGYGHLSQIDVAAGDVVSRGQIIARTGATGLAGGDHLHFEVFVHGISVNPLEWLDPSWIRNAVTSKLPGAAR